MKRTLRLNISKIAVYGIHIGLFLIGIAAMGKDVKDSTSVIGEYTSIPDEKFEQILINLGYDSGSIDHKVLTANISKVTYLDLSNKSITDLTGLQDFAA